MGFVTPKVSLSYKCPDQIPKGSVSIHMEDKSEAGGNYFRGSLGI
jgi:hypothetical protein